MADGGTLPSPRGTSDKRRGVVPIGMSLEQLVLQSSELSVEEKEAFSKQITPRSKSPALPDASVIKAARVSNQGEVSAGGSIGIGRRSNAGDISSSSSSSSSNLVQPAAVPVMLPAPPARRPPGPPPPIEPPLTPRSRALALPALALTQTLSGDEEDVGKQATPRSRRPEPVRFPGGSPLPSPVSSPRGKPLPALPIIDMEFGNSLTAGRGSNPGSSSTSALIAPPPETLTPRSREAAQSSRLGSAVTNIASDSLAMMSPRSIGHGIGKLFGSISTDDGKKEEKTEQLYAFHLALSRKEDLAPVAQLNVIFRAGVDHFKKPVFVCLAENIPKQRYDLDLLFLQAIAIMHQSIDNDYVFVYVHSRHLAEENKPKLSWLRKVHSALCRKYKKNLKAFYVVNYTFGVKMTLKLCKPFLSSKFFKKVKYINSPAELYKHIDKQQLCVSEHLLHDGSGGKLSSSGTASVPAAAAQMQPVFSISLSEAMKRRPGVNGLPQVLEACLTYLAAICVGISLFRNQVAPDTEGIFRLSGTSSNIDLLRKSYDKGQDVDLALVENVHDVASLLKLYLRELPEPLFPYALYDSILALVRDNTGGYRVWGSQLKVLLTHVPSINRVAMEHLMQLLNAVSANSIKNKMTASNLAIVFGPNILRSQTESLEALVSDAPLIDPSLMKKLTRFACSEPNDLALAYSFTSGLSRYLRINRPYWRIARRPR